jgi:hypothetical protein
LGAIHIKVSEIHADRHIRSANLQTGRYTLNQMLEITAVLSFFFFFLWLLLLYFYCTLLLFFLLLLFLLYNIVFVVVVVLAVVIVFYCALLFFVDLRSGDNVGINWGYFYTAAPVEDSLLQAMNNAAVTRSWFAANGAMLLSGSFAFL